MAHGVIPKKTCKWCGEEKPLNCFYASPNNKDGKQGHCKACDHKRNKKEEKERVAARKKAWEEATSKVCGRCKRDLPFEMFYPSKRGAWKLTSWCKDCQSETQSRRNTTPEGRAKKAEQARRFIANNPTYNSYMAKKKRAKDPELYASRMRRFNLKKKYGITPEDYERMLLEQRGICPICSTDRPGGNGGILVVDHDHATNKVRELLCHKCNAGIGYFGDNPALLRNAAAYLEKHSNKAEENTNARLT